MATHNDSAKVKVKEKAKKKAQMNLSKRDEHKVQVILILIIQMTLKSLKSPIRRLILVKFHIKNDLKVNAVKTRITTNLAWKKKKKWLNMTS